MIKKAIIVFFLKKDMLPLLVDSVLFSNGLDTYTYPSIHFYLVYVCLSFSDGALILLPIVVKDTRCLNVVSWCRLSNAL